MNKRELFFEDVATAMDIWADTAVEAMSPPGGDVSWAIRLEAFKRLQAAMVKGGATKDDIRLVFNEILFGFTHSILTIIDGGTEMAESGRLWLTDEEGKSIGEGLHELFPGYLRNSGREVL